MRLGNRPPARPTTRRSGPRTVARALLAPYVVVLALIVFLPARDAGRVTGVIGWAADLLATWGVPREPAAVVFEFLANVALFVPFGLLLSTAAPRWSPWAIIGLGALVSVMIELVQLGIPSRVATVSDLIANTAGAAVGCLVAARWRVSRECRPTSPRSR
jgi:VanZ family protein